MNQSYSYNCSAIHDITLVMLGLGISIGLFTSFKIFHVCVVCWVLRSLWCCGFDDNNYNYYPKYVAQCDAQCGGVIKYYSGRLLLSLVTIIRYYNTMKYHLHSTLQTKLSIITAPPGTDSNTNVIPSTSL